MASDAAVSPDDGQQGEAAQQPRPIDDEHSLPEVRVGVETGRSGLPGLERRRDFLREVLDSRQKLEAAAPDTPVTKRTPRTLGETAGLLRGQQWATDAWREHARLSGALGDPDGAAAAREAGQRSLDRELELMDQGTDDARELEEDPLEHLDFVEASAATIGRHAIDRRERGEEGTAALLGRQWALVLRAGGLAYKTSKDLPGTRLSVAEINMIAWETHLALIETVYDQALQDPDQGPALHEEVRSRLRALRMVQASAPSVDADLRWERVAHLNAQGLRTPEDRRVNAWAEVSALQGVAEDFLPGDGQAPVTRLLGAQELLNHGRPEDREAALKL